MKNERIEALSNILDTWGQLYPKLKDLTVVPGHYKYIHGATNAEINLTGEIGRQADAAYRNLKPLIERLYKYTALLEKSKQ